jgi:hypothetical protein
MSDKRSAKILTLKKMTPLTCALQARGAKEGSFIRPAAFHSNWRLAG